MLRQAQQSNKEVVNAPSSDEILDSMKTDAPVTSEVNKEISDILSGYTEKINIDESSAVSNEKEKRGRKKKGEKTEPVQEIQESPVITGALMMLLIDLAMPNLISFVNNAIVKKTKKGKKISASALMMTSEQRKELEPVADQVAKEMMLHANPLTILIISMIGIYGINFMILQNE